MTAPALDAAVELLVAAVRGGMRHLVVCPGSRSQALALVAAELERVGAVRLHVRIDERSAAFFALGLARESGRAVAAITTSGTAVANLHPAMLEAHHAGVPLIALTADRPAEMLGTAANQTTVQAGVFGALVPSLTLPAPAPGDDLAPWRDGGALLADAAGAFHLNLAFREPLSGAVPDLAGRVPREFAEKTAGAEDAAGSGAGADAAGAGGSEAALAAAGGLSEERDRRMPRHRPRGLPADLAAAIAADLAAHAAPAPNAAAEARPDSAAGSEAAGSEASVSDVWAPFVANGRLGAHPERSTATIQLDPAGWMRAVVIAGDGAGPLGERLARQGGWPLLAEPSSGSRFGRNVVVTHRDLLGPDSPAPGLRDGIELAIVVGHPTLTRGIPALLRRDDVRVVIVDDEAAPPVRTAPQRRRSDPAAAGGADREFPGSSLDAEEHCATLRITAFGATSQMPRVEATELRAEADEWLRGWLAASRALEAERSTDAPAPDIAASRSADLRERARFGREELAVAREPVTRRLLADAVWRATWPHDRLVLAASRLIRDLDAQVPGKRIRVHANRGLAGIDGTIATALGVAAASQFGDDEQARAGTTRLLIGDLAFAHDASSLLVGQGGEPAPRLQVIVGDDGGGTIFDGLEVRGTAAPEAFDRVQYTPAALDLAAIAAAYGWEHRRAATRGELEAALTSNAARIIIEVPLER